MSKISISLLKWFDKHGRHNLPWKKNKSPYRVWLSEIMLQQTKVATVVPYYQRFIRYFPNIKTLALGDLEMVLSLWSGLGYYARARNLHRCANIIHNHYHDQFPKTILELEKLPGIGRSTAGAILSFSYNIPAPILDGNIKRVLTRFKAIDGFPCDTKTLKHLWLIAEKYTPKTRCNDYNQAMMDLGAIVCTRLKPKCTQCPLMKNCKAYLEKQPTRYPTPNPKKTRPQKTTIVLLLQNEQGEILLEKRRSIGIWGGLWSFPEYENINTIHHYCSKTWGLKILKINEWGLIYHQFSHFTLAIKPVFVQVQRIQKLVGITRANYWHHKNNPLPGGVAAPIKKLLDQLFT